MSSTSFMVSGTFILCFSVTVCANDTKDGHGRGNGYSPIPFVHMLQPTYLRGQCLLCDHLERVHYRDVTQPLGDGQSAVSILHRKQKNMTHAKALLLTLTKKVYSTRPYVWFFGTLKMFMGHWMG